ncbi:MAG: MFS transporter [Silvanigrellaceae bacterium]|nr:MFS transporter [Silvanigrellaceae bacterium]
MSLNFFSLPSLQISSIFLVILLDSIGMSLIMPLLGPLILEGNSSLLPVSTSVGLRNFLYGVSLSSFALFMFIGAPIMGDLSDKLGRKPILLLCMIGAFLGYGFSGLGAHLKNVSLFLLGRSLTGFTAGSLPIAQASIIDISNSQNKTANLGIILFGVSIGYIIGPLFSGFLSDEKLSSYFSVFLPLYAACFLSLIAAIFIFFFVKETRKEKLNKVKWWLGFSTLWLAFKDNKIRYLSIIFLLVQFGWALYFQYVTLFLDKTVFSPDISNETQGVSIFMALTGFGMAFSFCYLIRIVNKIFNASSAILMALITIICSLSLIIIFQNPWLMWMNGFISGMGFGIVYPCFMTLFSEHANQSTQGLIMGIASTICAFAAFTSAIFGVSVADLSPYCPIICAALILFISFLVWYGAFFNKKTSHNQKA